MEVLLPMVEAIPLLVATVVDMAVVEDMAIQVEANLLGGKIPPPSALPPRPPGRVRQDDSQGTPYSAGRP